MSAAPNSTRPKRVGILFAGGPAPAANAVISTAAASFLKNGIEVYGILKGYSGLVQFGPERPMQLDRDYIHIDQKRLKRTRNTQGIIIGTARTNPGKKVESMADLHVEENVKPLRTVYQALRSLEIDALVSIGGDDTLKSANKFKLYQDTLPADAKRIPVVHVPKTIDNDYSGIDFTFGYFTAVETLASEIRNLLADAESSGSYFLVESMGRSAGWLAYGAAIAGEASFAFSVEDVTGEYAKEEDVHHEDGTFSHKRKVMDVDKVVGRIVRMMKTRRQRDNKDFGVMVLAEGLAELLPYEYIKNVPRDEHKHIAITEVNLGRFFAKRVAEAYKKETGESRKVTGVQLGYEVRCARPTAFDVMLGSQLGVGAYRALAEESLNGVMVSVSGQLDLHFVKFEELVNAENLVTKVRFVEPASDFHKLVRFLEGDLNR